MKKKYCFLVDTSADPEIVKLDPNIEVMSINIVVGKDGQENSYADWKEITRKEVFDYMAKNYDLKTAQPTLGLIQEKMEMLIQKYEKVIVLPISSNLSGTYNTCMMVKKELEKTIGKNRILVADSKSITYLQSNLLIEIRQYLEKGLDLAAIENLIKDYEKKYCCATIVSNPIQLIKGGRLKGLKAILVKALNLKLIIKFQNGKLDFEDKAKDIFQAMDKSIAMLNKQLNFSKNKVKCIHIMSDLQDADTKQYSQYVAEKMKEFYTGKIEQGKLPTTIITHLGNGSFTIFVDIE
ncbi:MAG: DegV family protein [Mycoplasma sp.]